MTIRWEHNMSIHFRGKLINDQQLEMTDISEYKKIKPSSIDYILTILLLALPMFFGVQLLMSHYDGSIINVIIGDIIGMNIVIGIMLCHEFLHAMTFSKNHNVAIWYRGFTMLTYCTEEKTSRSMIYTLLLPHVIITLPMIVLAIILVIYDISSLYVKIYGLISLIIILGSLNDIAQAILILRNMKKIHQIKLNRYDFYYK